MNLRLSGKESPAVLISGVGVLSADAAKAATTAGAQALSERERRFENLRFE
jgi:hypothetical protein